MDNNHKDLKITLLQTHLFWERKNRNLEFIYNQLLEYRGKQHLIVLPEMFSTGFSMHPKLLAEPMEGETIRWMTELAQELQCVISGTLMIKENGDYYNRFVWVGPDGSIGYYDKRHLFSMGQEPYHFSSGMSRRVFIIHGWRIMPLICYDLRFPVWSMNQYDESGYLYDLLLYPANWPARRSQHWRSLLMARAIENQCYVAGVNRTGEDGNGVPHAGDSMIIDPLGKILQDAGAAPVCILHQTLSWESMILWRKKFPVGADWGIQDTKNLSAL